MRLRHRSWSNRVLNENKDIGLTIEDLTPESLLGYDRLEIGSGLGGFLLACAKRWPEKKFLGVEVALNAYAAALKKLAVEKESSHNFTLVHAPVERLLPYLPSGHFEAIYINFPDPWPKKRQQHRRLSSDPLIREYYRLLKKGGKVYFRTDNEPLFEDSLESFSDTNLFTIESIVPFLSEKVDFLPSTEYERKFRAQGLPIHLLIATK